MNKKQITLSIILSIIILFSAYSTFQSTGKVVQGETQTILLTKQNLPLYLNQHQITKDIPKSATIGFQFYSIQNGQQVWEEKYLLKNKKIELKDFTNEKTDIIISMNSKYFSLFGDICHAIKTANQNGDLQYNVKISKTSLLWKYKGMLKYKNCF